MRDHASPRLAQFCCIDQDTDPGDELTQLDRLLRKCDIILTPIVDPDHASWKAPQTLTPGVGWLVDYKAAAWTEYWTRGWCRVEAMLGAAYPVDDGERRAAFFRGGLKTALLAGRRPHLLYGTKEQVMRDSIISHHLHAISPSELHAISL